jgi:hypothetical protein
MTIGFGLLITILVQLTLKAERPLGANEEAVDERGLEADRYSL